MGNLLTRRIYRKAVLGVFSLALIGSATSAMAFSYSWFSNRNNISKDFKGSVAGAWFAGGDGSEGSPYELASPRHVYNLAWLQYSGAFNQVSTSGTSSALRQYYFIVDNDIDMNGMAIPPIGTEENPFVGNFDGNGKIISNLTISNSAANFTSIPSKISGEGYVEAAIIGFFGVVGQYDGSPSAYTDENRSANSVHDLYLDRITVRNSLPSGSTSAAKTNVLAGFLAGYVNGEMKRCGVHRARFDFAKGTTNIAGSSFGSVTDYSLIGSYNSDNYSWADGPGGEGQESGFGGSIDMLSINRRIGYILAVSETKKVSNGGTRFINDTYNINIGASSSTNETYWNATSSSGSVSYLYEDSYLPLNIDEYQSGLVDEDGNTIVEEINSTVRGWKTTDFYNKGTPEIITDSNSGYLVGSSGGLRSRIQKIDGGSTYGISCSFGKLSNDTKTYTTYDKKQAIELLTVDASSHKQIRIQDSNNINNSETAFDGITRKTASSLGLTQYDKVLTNFNKRMKGSYHAHGFHFYNLSTTFQKVTHSATLLGKTYNNYQFLSGALNFTLGSNGTITNIIGSYYNGSKNTLYNLYKIERDQNNDITGIKIINKIYKSASNETVYLYSDGKYSDHTSNSMTLSFDFEYLTNSDNVPLKQGTAYYFEYPLLKGDYAIGAESTNKNTAYLMYLDIGANASSDTSTTTAGTISEIDFVYEDSAGIIKITDDNYETVKSGIAFAWAGTSEAELIYFRRFRISSGSGTSATVTTPVYYWDTPTTAGFAMTIVPSTGTNYARDEKCVWT